MWVINYDDDDENRTCNPPVINQVLWPLHEVNSSKAIAGKEKNHCTSRMRSQPQLRYAQIHGNSKIFPQIHDMHSMLNTQVTTVRRHPIDFIEKCYISKMFENYAF